MQSCSLSLSLLIASKAREYLNWAQKATPLYGRLLALKANFILQVTNALAYNTKICKLNLFWNIGPR